MSKIEQNPQKCLKADEISKKSPKMSKKETKSDSLQSIAYYAIELFANWKFEKKKFSIHFFLYNWSILKSGQHPSLLTW